MDNEDKKTLLEEADDYTLMNEDAALMSAAKDTPTLPAKKTASKKAPAIKEGAAKPIPAPEKIIDLSADYLPEQLPETEEMRQPTVPAVKAAKPKPARPSPSKKSASEHTERPSFDEYADYMASQEPQARASLSVKKPLDAFNATMTHRTKGEAPASLSADAALQQTDAGNPPVQASFIEKMRGAAQRFIASKSSNWFFVVGLGLFIIAFVFFKIHHLSSSHTQSRRAESSSSFAPASQGAPNTPAVNQAAIAVAGEGVIPDDNGFASDAVTMPVAPSAPATQAVSPEQLADITQKLDGMNTKLDAIQTHIEGIETKLSPPPVDKPIPVKVLGVLQNQRDDRWHADVLIKGQVFDVVTGDTVAGVRIVSVSAHGVDYHNAS